MKRGEKWSDERKLLQSQLIKRWKPWEKAKGPTTIEGKEKSKMNAYKHGMCDKDMRGILKTIAYVKRINRKIRRGEAIERNDIG